MQKAGNIKARLSSKNISPNNCLFTHIKNLQTFIDKYTAGKVYKKILDFGAGNSPYKDFFHSTEYITVDVGQNINSSIDVIINPKETILPFKDNEFDVVLCFDVLEHVIFLDQILAELSRILTPNGIILISIPFIFREHEYPNDYWRFTSKGLEIFLKNNGFYEIKMVKNGNFYLTLYLLWIGKYIKQGEVSRMPIVAKLVNKIFFNKACIYILNKTLFAKKVSTEDQIFLSLFVCAKKNNI